VEVEAQWVMMEAPEEVVLTVPLDLPAVLVQQGKETMVVTLFTQAKAHGAVEVEAEQERSVEILSPEVLEE
jgi:hypothetical protein